MVYIYIKFLNVAAGRIIQPRRLWTTGWRPMLQITELYNYYPTIKLHPSDMLQICKWKYDIRRSL